MQAARPGHQPGQEIPERTTARAPADQRDVDAAALVAVEAAAIEDICAAANPDEREATGLYCQYHGETLVLACPAEDGILMNRCIGFSGADQPRLDDILAVYRDLGVRRAFLSMDEADAASLRGMMNAHGLEEARAWVKFVRDDSPADTVKSRLVVSELRPLDKRHCEAFGEIVADAFDLPAPFAQILARLPGREYWHVFMTFEGSQPAGCGALYVRDGIAWLGFGATHPDFRCRGSQGAVMAARIECARKLGAVVMNTETGEAVPGDPQHSYRNIERAGFRPHHRILNLALQAQQS